MLKAIAKFEDGTEESSIVLAESADEAYSIWKETIDPLWESVHGRLVDFHARPLFGSERMELGFAVREKLGLC